MEERKNKNEKPLAGGGCPEDHLIALYALGECSSKESEFIQLHIRGCERCRDIIQMQNDISEESENVAFVQAPPELVEMAKSLVSEKYGHNLLHIKAAFGRHVFNVLNTTGDIIFGPLSQPAALLRDGHDDKRSNLLIEENFDDLSVKVEISRGEGDQNSIVINTTDLKTKKDAKNLRFTLLENDDELESRASPDGKTKFDEIKPGRYTVEINRPDKLVGAVRFHLIHDEPS